MSSTLPPNRGPAGATVPLTGPFTGPLTGSLTDRLAGSPVERTAYQRSIMLIDDSLAVRKVLEASFARVQLPVATFPDGISAIHALSHGEVEVPDLLLLDIGLPKMDGYEVAGILRNNDAFRQTIVIMLTGRDGMIDRIRSRMVGARDFISKPFRVSQVVDLVCEHLQVTPR